MKAHILLLLSVIFLFPIFLFSQSITEKQAKIVAKNFFYEKSNINKKIAYEDIQLQIKQSYTKNNTIVFRVFEPLNKPGFIMVSSDERIIPVLGYSTENLYKTDIEFPSNFKEWIEGYAKQIEYAETNSVKTKNPLWEKYSEKPDLKNIKSTKNVDPLLTTTWNQGSGYNNFCPIDNGSHVWAGCVATAMAQIMNYHEHPVSGEGSHSYIHPVYGEQSADFESAIYDWAGMPDHNGNDEISELIYHCGVSVNMNYSPSGSGAYSSSVVGAWKNYFKYSSNLILTSKGSYTEENWAKMLIAEIDAGRPLYYHGYGSGGHAFNVDGYQGTDYFHFNWGWGGSYNGNFYLDDLTPGGMNFTNSQGAIIGTQDRDTYPGLDCSSPVILTTGVPYYGSTTGSTNIVNKYGSAYYHSTGKEVVHQITTSFPGRIRASLTNLNDSILDVFILSHCNQDSLLAYGDTTAFADNTTPGTYYIVVDGRYAYEGDYTLTVTVPTNEADLVITNQSIEPYKIEAGGIGNVSFKIKNIGNSSAGTSKTNIFYSEDNSFDGSDILIDQINIPALNIGSEHEINQIITMPAGVTEGLRYVLFIADAENDVIETDEIYNTETANFEVPEAGIMDCSSSVSLTNDVWYYGNTETDGIANIDNYPCWWKALTGKETIHSISATHTGVANFSFTEKVPGEVSLFVLSSCNENTCLNSFAIWNPEDTLMQESIQVFAGITYYFIVDAEEGNNGAYGLKVKMPGACPEPVIKAWGNTEICEASTVSLETSWLYSDIQWLKNNVPIPDETSSWFQASETGEYKVKVTENECSGFSDIIDVVVSPPPSHANINAVGDTTFCEGNSVTLNLNTGTGYIVQWMKNGNPVEGETALSFIAEETGVYTAEVTNISCSINSNEKQVTANPVTADIGEPARVNSNNLLSWFSCDINDNTDLSGNGNDYFGSWNFPEDRKGNWNKATYYNGEWDSGTTTNTFDNPNTFTLSVWIKTNTNTGGMILGLGDNQWTLSTNSDRMIYMDDTGKIYFGVIDETAKTVSTTESYNDNNWHLVNASLSNSGMKLYIDGELKAEDTNVTNGANYIGYWKIAYDNIDLTFPNVPTSLYYKGVIDEIKIYGRELLPKEITYLYEENNVFDVTLEENAFCESGSTNIILTNTENFIEYQLRNNADNSLIGSTITGTTEIITLPTGVLTETTTFNILATNPITGCSFELNNLFTVSINDLPTANLSGGETICEGETTEISIDLTGQAPWDITYTDGTNSFNATSSNNPYVFSVTNAGTYQVTALNDNNCIGTEMTGSATVIVNELPNVNLGEDVNITTNQSVTLDAGPGFVTYSWSDGSEEQTLLIEGYEQGIGTFQFNVLVEDINTCENSDTIIVNITQEISVENFENSLITFFPNPTNDIINISYNKTNIGSDKIYLKIINSTGQELLLKPLLNKNNKFNLRNYGSGIYFLEIITDKKIYSKKVIVNP